MKDNLIHICLDILKRKDIKNEIKSIISPLTDIILIDIYPYIYIIILFVLLIFFIILVNLVLLILTLRNKNNS